MEAVSLQNALLSGSIGGCITKRFERLLGA
jgi:hypothetical protein